MPANTSFDAIVIGSGPNGLAAAVELARAGLSVCVYEANETIGGGTRSAELTRPGFLHDVCSAVHPLAASSPFFSSLPLSEYGLEFIEPPIALAHPFDDGRAATLHRSLEVTAENLVHDGTSYLRLMAPLVKRWNDLTEDILGPPHLPRHPLTLARFGFNGIRSAKSLVHAKFKEGRTRALFAGLAAHSFLSLDQLTTAAFALVLAANAHVTGWPIVRGGSQKIAGALAGYIRHLGGEIVTRSRVQNLNELPKARLVLCDVTPRQLLQIARDVLPVGYRRKLEQYRYGPAAFKIDWALQGPVPWKSENCAQAATVHVGGTWQEVADAEATVWRGTCANKPFVLVCQPSLFDQTRAPSGQHTLWAYCHVPHGSKFDMTERIENQIERFAPGFRGLVLERSVMSPARLEEHNANLIGGDINGGLQDWKQFFTRPTIHTYSTPLRWLYLCSSSTPPGGGVHGMCGYHAARRALRGLRK